MQWRLWLNTVFVLVHAISCGVISIDEEKGRVLLEISTGKLLGKFIDSYDNRTGIGFLGIPFAKPLTGARRYALPEKAEPWEGIRDVTEKGPACPAVPRLTYKRPEGGPMSDDCLHNYVYTSRKCLEKGGCAVMAVIHGGRWTFESPVVFMDKAVVHNFASDGQDVIVVAVAYRLGSFGFLNLAPHLETNAVKNAAVHDVLRALTWIQEEIHHFGGSKARVTVMGHSGGAQFADLLTLVPQARGLFQQAVSMSGAALCTTGNILTTMNQPASWRTAELLNCTWDGMDREKLEDVNNVIDCLSGRSWQEIVASNEELFKYPEDFHGPSMDGPGGVLPDTISNLMERRTPIPMMIGTVSAEFRESKYILDENRKPDPTKLAELCRTFGYVDWHKNGEAMSNECIRTYSEGDLARHILEDYFGYYPTLTTAITMAKRGNPVYLYNYGYTGALAAFTNYLKLDPADRPGHSEDFIYIFGMHRGNFTEKDLQIERIYSGMVLNFVKTGYPDPGNGQVWKQFTQKKHNYFEIDFDDNLRMPGNQEKYYPRAEKLWITDAEKIGGGYQAHKIQPGVPYDFNAMAVVDAFASHYLNVSQAHDKTLAAEQKYYQEWRDFGARSHAAHQRKSVPVPHDADVIKDVEAAFDAGHMPIFELVMITMTVALLIVMFKIWMDWIQVYKTRKHYSPLKSTFPITDDQ